jgi:hypothetical protein
MIFAEVMNYLQTSASRHPYFIGSQSNKMRHTYDDPSKHLYLFHESFRKPTPLLVSLFHQSLNKYQFNGILHFKALTVTFTVFYLNTVTMLHNKITGNFTLETVVARDYA